MNTVLYQYFKDYYGSVNDSSNSVFVSKYRDASVRELKKRLKQLNLECVNICDINHASPLLRTKICKPGSLANDLSADYDEYIGKIFGAT